MLGTSSSLFYNPSSIAVDSQLNVYVSDTGNNVVKKIAKIGGTASVLAGSIQNSGSTNHNVGGQARFYRPMGLSLDSTETFLYVCDAGNHLIRRIVVGNGTTTTFSGVAGASGYLDGLSTLSKFNTPVGLAADDYGSLFVADQKNHVIRKIIYSANPFQLDWVSLPISIRSNVVLTEPPPIVRVLDYFYNSISGSNVSITLYADPFCSVPTNSSSGYNWAVSNSTGHAVFSQWMIVTVTGRFYLKASVANVYSDCSSLNVLAVN